MTLRCAKLNSLIIASTNIRCAISNLEQQRDNKDTEKVVKAQQSPLEIIINKDKNSINVRNLV